MSAPTAPPLPPETKPSRFMRWHHRVLGFCLVIFAFEVGLFLVVFPWMPNWNLNWVPSHSKTLSDIWENLYFRGAVSGLGLLNLWVSLVELVKQLKSLFGR